MWQGVADRFFLSHEPHVHTLVLNFEDRHLEPDARAATGQDVRWFTFTRGVRLPAKYARVIELLNAVGEDVGAWDWLLGSAVHGVGVEGVLGWAPEDLSLDDLLCVLEPPRVNADTLPKVCNLDELLEEMIGAGLRRSASLSPTANAVEKILRKHIPPRMVTVTSTRIRDVVAELRGSLPTVLAVNWPVGLTRPAPGSRYRVRIATRWEGKLVRSKRGSRAGRSRSSTDARSTDCSEEPERSLLKLPDVGGLVEMVRAALGVDLRAPADSTEFKVWQETLLRRLKEVQPDLDGLDRRARVLLLPPTRTRDDVEKLWAKVERDRDRHGIPRKKLHAIRVATYQRWADRYKRLGSWEKASAEEYGEYAYHGHCPCCRNWFPVKTEDVEDNRVRAGVRCPACDLTGFDSLRDTKLTARNMKERVRQARSKKAIR